MILTNFNFPRIFFAGIIAFREKMVYNSMYKGNTDLRLLSQKKAHKSKTFFCESPNYSVFPKISCKGNQKWKLYIPTF